MSWSPQPGILLTPSPPFLPPRFLYLGPLDGEGNETPHFDINPERDCDNSSGRLQSGSSGVTSGGVAAGDEKKSKRGRLTSTPSEALTSASSSTQPESDGHNRCDGAKSKNGHDGKEGSPHRSDEEEGEGKRDLSKRVAESDLTGPRAKAARTVIASGGSVGGVAEGLIEGDADLKFVLGDALDHAPITVVILVSGTGGNGTSRGVRRPLVIMWLLLMKSRRYQTPNHSSLISLAVVE